MKVEVLKGFGRYAPGDIIPEMPYGQADMLIRRGLIKAASDIPVTVPIGSYTDRQMTPAAKSSKRRKGN